MCKVATDARNARAVAGDNKTSSARCAPSRIDAGEAVRAAIDCATAKEESTVESTSQQINSNK